MKPLPFLEFYAKYWDEMDAYYLEDDGVAIDGNGAEGLGADPEKIAKQIDLAGDQACEDAADLLLTCESAVTSYLGTKFRVERIERRKTIVSNWDLEVRLWLKAKPSRPKMTIGVSILKFDNVPAIVPWIWRLGGSQGTDETAELLGVRLGKRDRDLGWTTGTVTLPAIPLLDAKETLKPPAILVEQVKSAFGLVELKEYEQLYRAVGKR
jgi:hypothetical protein